MSIRLRFVVGGLTLMSLGSGCGESGRLPVAPKGLPPATKGPLAPASISADISPFFLISEPAGAKGVIELRKDAKDGDDVLAVGRIGGTANPWVENRAAFTIVNTSLKPCNEKGDDGCKTPWDYCCDTDVLSKSMASVKFVEPDGNTAATDARKLLGVKELQTVVVKGKAKRDDAGNLVILAKGIFVRK